MTEIMPISNVFIVEDHPVMRYVLHTFLRSVPGIRVEGAASSAEEALDVLPKIRSNIIMVDVSLPGMSGIDLVKKVVASRPGAQCLMLSGHEEERYVRRALAAGARAYILKGDPGEIPEAIRRVANGEIFVSAPFRSEGAKRKTRGNNS